MSIDNANNFFVKDFYRRTLEILTNYEGDYDVTLLINSMLGLLIVPKERYFSSNKLKDDFIEEELLNKLKKSIKSNLVGELNNTNISLKEIIRHLRNATSHGHLTLFGEKGFASSSQIIIKSIKFIDKGSFKDKVTQQYVQTYFEAEIGVELLREFLIAFATNTYFKSSKNKGVK